MISRTCPLLSVIAWRSCARRHDFHARLPVARSSSFFRPIVATYARCAARKFAGLLCDAEQCAQQKVGRLEIESRQCDQSAEIGEMMNSEPLLVAVSAAVAVPVAVAAHRLHHVTTGSISPRTFASGTGPK